MTLLRWTNKLAKGCIKDKETDRQAVNERNPELTESLTNKATKQEVNIWVGFVLRFYRVEINFIVAIDFTASNGM